MKTTIPRNPESPEAPAEEPARRRPRLLVFIVAYNAERTIEDVLQRIPAALLDRYDAEALIIDDSSQDRTFELGVRARTSAALPFELHTLYNPVNQGYGGNQKIGFHFAIRNGFDFVALLHGDAQYAPEALPRLVEPLADGEADAVLGSRMLGGGALSGGMPLYKFVGNKVLTSFQNRLLHMELTEFHSGYRVYAVRALQQIPFDLNTNDFHFDTEIIIQLAFGGFRIQEVPIPTHYGDELCHVNGLKYAWDVTRTTTRARVQQANLLYDRKYDSPQVGTLPEALPKLEFESVQRMALEVVPAGARVLDLKCAGGYVAAALRERGCHVTGVDSAPLAEGVELDAFHLHDPNDPDLPVDPAGFDYVLMLDLLGQLDRPEALLERISAATATARDVRLVVSAANVAFAPTRLLLLSGQFNYSKRGILDLRHRRLFTFSTLGRLLEGAGFEPVLVRGAPAPFPLAVETPSVANALLAANRALVRVRKSLFAYQIFLVARRRPSLELLLADAEHASHARVASTGR